MNKDQLLTAARAAMKADDFTAAKKLLLQIEKIENPAAYNDRLKKKDGPRKGKEASFFSQAESYFVDDPSTKIRILAKNRFPDLPEEERVSRYSMPDGEIAYSENGELYKSMSGGVPEFFAELVGKAPAELGAIAGGAIGSWPGALAGGFIGENIRQAMGPAVYGAPVDIPQSLKKSATQSALLGGGFALERGIAGAGRMIANSKMKPSTSLGYDPAETAKAYAEAQKRGVQLTPAEASGSRALEQQQHFVGVQPSTADQVSEFYNARAPQVENAIREELKRISPSRSVDQGNKKATRAFSDRLAQRKAERTAAASPYYTKAENDVVDISDITEEINQIANQHSGTEYGKKFKQAYNSLTAKNEAGDRVAKTTVGEIQEAKESIDLLINGAKVKGAAKMAGRLTKLKNRVVDRMIDASKEYEKGHAAYMRRSPPINEMKGTSFYDVLPKKPFTDPDYDKAVDKVFSVNKSPESVLKIRKIIKGQEPEAWDAIVKSYMLSKLNKIKVSAQGGEIPNLAGQYNKMVFGSPGSDEFRKLKNALTPLQFETLNNFSELLKQVSRVTKGQSMTQPLQEMKSAVGGNARNMLSIALAPRSALISHLDDMKMEQHLGLLADMITNTKNMADFNRNVQKMRRYAPGRKRYAPTWYEDALTAALSSLGVAAVTE
jgi:hypothetical protein